MTPRQRTGIAALALSAAGLVYTVSNEGYSSSAIIPVPGDVPTIGYGTTGGVKMGDKITPPKALARALADVQKYEGAVKQCVTVPLSQDEYDAYLDLAYNIGPGLFCQKADKQRKNADGSPNPEPDRLIDLINAGQYGDACRRVLSFNKFHGKPQPGLTKRRQSEYQKCMGATA